MWFSTGKVRCAAGKTCWALSQLSAAPWPFYGQITEEKRLILMKRVRNDPLSHGFDKNRQEISFLRWFCAPGSESWLGRAAILGDGEMRCGCRANESDLAAVPSAWAPSQLLPSPFSARSPARQFLPGTGTAELEPCGGCRSSTGSDPSYWPHL